MAPWLEELDRREATARKEIAELLYRQERRTAAGGDLLLQDGDESGPQQ
jgi:hypothetical protein